MKVADKNSSFTKRFIRTPFELLENDVESGGMGFFV